MMTTSVFQGRSILAETDLSPQEMHYLVEFAEHLKDLQKQGIPHRYLEGKNIALLFEKASTRTRSAFVTAANELGAHPDYLGKDDIHLGTKESVADTAKVLGRMFDGIEFRGYKQETVAQLAQYSEVPVWNGLTDKWHPTQTIADLMTIKENFGHLKGIKLAYLGDGRNNVAHSLLIGCAMVGIDVAIVSPTELFPDDDIISLARKYAAQSGATVKITAEIATGVAEANVIYTDVWVSMGESNWTQRIELLLPYQVNLKLLQRTGNMGGDNLIFLHCLPAFHDTQTQIGEELMQKYHLSELEVTDEVFQSRYARQFDQAENRKHGIKAMMAATLGNLYIPGV